MGNKTALLVVDVQTGFIDGNPCVYQAQDVLARIGDLIAKARAANVPVVYIQHNSAPEYDGPIHPAIEPQPGEPVILKYRPDSFYETNLQAELDARDIDKLILMGFQTEFCIDTTCRRASSLDYDITLVQDAHSTFDGTALNAAQIIAHHSAVLAEFATVKNADQIRFD